MSIFDTLFCAWLMSWFDLDEILIKATNEVLGTNYSTAVYWLVAFALGVILSIV